ncbi:hypothetical protein CEP54_009272 [Fusarium duplospermum]|uniref:Uncharacterized protein n=1 Tax=Fusarium duplospermum TaxID=1325734 RepID=A0A428PRT6_9HYPO|nr:hypothetical protein CEP54_009272 [Fusarium duplospermum]
MAVGLDYFRKWYGALLCQHSIKRAEEDKVPVRVIAAALSMNLSEALEYTCTAKIGITDERPDKQASIAFWVQKWDPSNGTAE